MSYSLTAIWVERQRFLPVILAVAFSAVLVAVQSHRNWGHRELFSSGETIHDVLSLFSSGPV